MNISIPIKVEIKAKASTDSNERKLELIEQRLAEEISFDEREYLINLKATIRKEMAYGKDYNRPCD